MYVSDMERETHSPRVMPIIIPRLHDPASVSVDERDEHLMLLEAARQHLDVEWTETLSAAEAAGDHDVMGYTSMVAYLKHRMGMAGGRAHRYVRNARTAGKFRATLSAWRHRQISGDEAELLFRAAERTPDKYPEAENVLLELVVMGSTRPVASSTTGGVTSICPGVALESEEQMARRHFDVTRRANGMLAGKFELPTLQGEALARCRRRPDAATGRWRRPDHVPAPRRCARRSGERCFGEPDCSCRGRGPPPPQHPCRPGRIAGSAWRSP